MTDAQYKQMPEEEWKKLPDSVRAPAVAGIHAKYATMMSVHYIPLLDARMAAAAAGLEGEAAEAARRAALAETVVVVTEAKDPFAPAEQREKGFPVACALATRTQWRDRLLAAQKEYREANPDAPEARYSEIIEVLAAPPEDGHYGQRYWIVVHGYGVATIQAGTTVAGTHRGGLEPDAPRHMGKATA